MTHDNDCPELPTTVDEVQRAEEALEANPIPLPERLRDPYKLLEMGLSREDVVKFRAQEEFVRDMEARLAARDREASS